MKELNRPDPAPVIMAVLPANDIAIFRSLIEAMLWCWKNWKDISPTRSCIGFILHVDSINEGYWLTESLPMRRAS